MSGVRELGDAQLSYGDLEDWEGIGRLDSLLELARQCWRARGLGDFWSYMLVAEGVAEIAVDPVVSVWDIAASQVIVEEAGGRQTDLSGRAGRMAAAAWPPTGCSTTRRSPSWVTSQAIT